ncbi:MAG TPA: hypothetical protein VK610_03115 [Rhodothermales bacterium]|nr:hypothetical protein [Rhodothermales bacterium]
MNAPGSPRRRPPSLPAPVVVHVGRGVTVERTAHVDASPPRPAATRRALYVAAVLQAGVGGEHGRPALDAPVAPASCAR